MPNLFMRFPGSRAKAFTMSYDDGVVHDIRLIEIMTRYGLKGTFNINAGMFAPEGIDIASGKRPNERLTEKEVVALYGKAGQEVAVHGFTHPYLEQLPAACACYEIMEDRRKLETLFGRTVRGMAYPFGSYNDTVIEILKNAGIVYARTVESTESFGIPTDWLRLQPTCHHKNPRLFELADSFLKKDPTRVPQLFYLWGHSYEFDREGNWNLIEELGKKIGGHDDVWYATNIEIYDYIADYRQLRFSADMQFVENPTHRDLYFSWMEQNRVVQAGQTLFL